jgi:hypothetical protein
VQVMESAIVRIAEATEAQKNTELAVAPSCERLYDLLRQAEERGDALGAAFAEHLLALLRNRFLVSTAQLPPDVRAGVLVRHYRTDGGALSWMIMTSSSNAAIRRRPACVGLAAAGAARRGAAAAARGRNARDGRRRQCRGIPFGQQHRIRHAAGGIPRACSS